MTKCHRKKCHNVKNGRNGVIRIQQKCYRGVLFYKLRESFPNSKIHFQSLLPLPCRNNRGWDTNTRVLETCKMIINECSYHRFYYLDTFHRFAIPFNSRKHDDPRCRNEKLFEKSGIHPNVLRGMGALASLYMKALHSSYCNPFCIQ